MAPIKSFICHVCRKRRLRKSAFIHPITLLCRWCAPSMQEKMQEAHGCSLEHYMLELVLVAQEDERPGT